MEDWLEFDFMQMPMIQNRACGQMPLGQMMMPQQMQPMPYKPMPYAPYAPQTYTENQPMDQVQTPTSITPPPSTPIAQIPTPGSTGSPDFAIEPGAPVQQDVNYTQGYLKTQIGKRVRIEFLIGTGIVTDRIGTLLEVGISYVVIQPVDTDDLLMCDIYSIKFVTIYQ
ncbi:hypothetical protein CLHOM_15490 [Clostridium homopropionicum DSM 5847]|uniref:Spore coat protein GerQ n=1 Tax=Clostridium homopropionicum DSM 5847 TaxID=1121318 RepID=A0A0L6ZAI2_9CLOT|nr:hypothetical protein [Clostridium homopropionicum]KOA19984.1 hypothetical protein CLHOM_15490 [Clostridium homopropionicum DSM 5847]SFG63955.1 hypothetical protein SAMN04488501_11223 [Clostridium homopropionicum]